MRKVEGLNEELGVGDGNKLIISGNKSNAVLVHPRQVFSLQLRFKKKFS